MGLIILLSAGAILGWLAAIILRREDAREILGNVAAGTGGSVLAGALASKVSILSGLSAMALLIGLLGATAAIAALNLFRYGALASSGRE